MIDLADIRAATEGLPRSYEVLVRDRIKFRVGNIVYLSVAPDESRLDAIDVDELRELVIDAWTMCVPKRVAAAYLES
jgi:hypothetical protein